MPAATSKSAFLRGIRAAAPFLVVVIPFGMLFGVVGTEAGLSLVEVMSFTTLVIAGASQFTALQLMAEEAPTLIVIASALAVNLRMAMYSAALAPHLGAAPFWQRALIAYMNVDQTYALSHQNHEDHPAAPLADKVAFFFGTCVPIVPLWVAATWTGVVVGAAIPPQLGLDFAVPITFLALIGPALRTLAHVAAALTSVVMAVLLSFLPWNLWLLAAGLAAMIVGAEVERRMALRGRP
ncbi:MAG: AzlC family ABC transporter permease [Roseicyclus sp.]